MAHNPSEDPYFKTTHCNRFELNPYFGDNGWQFTKSEREMFDWLESNVSPRNWEHPTGIPMVGDSGWRIYLCGRDDPDMTAYGWKFQDFSYRNKGPVGYWLQIDDDAKAIEFRLSGLYERVCWTGEYNHFHFWLKFQRIKDCPDIPYPDKHRGWRKDL